MTSVSTDLVSLLQGCLNNPEDADRRLILADCYEEMGDADNAKRQREEAERIRKPRKPDGYNGWTNYETWNVALWLDNEEYEQRRWVGEAERICEEHTEDGAINRYQATNDLARDLKQWFDVEECPQLEGTYGDLLNAALSEVNWREIAEHYVAEVPDPEPEEDSKDCDGCGKELQEDEQYRLYGEILCGDCANSRE